MYVCMYVYIYIYIHITYTNNHYYFVIVSLLRLLDSESPGSSLWVWEFHPLR